MPLEQLRGPPQFQVSGCTAYYPALYPDEIVKNGFLDPKKEVWDPDACQIDQCGVVASRHRQLSNDISRGPLSETVKCCIHASLWPPPTQPLTSHDARTFDTTGEEAIEKNVPGKKQYPAVINASWRQTPRWDEACISYSCAAPVVLLRGLPARHTAATGDPFHF